MSFEWDRRKAATNRNKHGIDFADAVAVFEDPWALTMPNETTDERRSVAIGTDMLGRVLVVVYTWRGDRSASSRHAGQRPQNAASTKGEP